MLVNADFSQPVTITPSQHKWIASPQRGVERIMLDRIGTEVARATSIVRYAPASSFPRHRHEAGEEILVLSGVFSDESGHYPAGWYIRNPPGSSHRPYTDEGATIFVKLRQMASAEKGRVCIDTNNSALWRHDTNGHAFCPLFIGNVEEVCLRRLTGVQTLSLAGTGGAEILVVSGKLAIDGQVYPAASWLRYPAGSMPVVQAFGKEATFYIKTGHLGVS